MPKSSNPAFWLILLIGLVGFTPSARPEAVPTDPDGFTRYVMATFGKTWPELTLAEQSPLELSIQTPDGTRHLAYLNTLYNACLHLPEQCEHSVANQVRQLISDFRAPTVALDRARLRTVVRPSVYVDQMRQAQQRAGSGDPVATRFVGGLWAICMQDMPDTMRTVTPAALSAAGLSPGEALAIGEANLAAALRPLKSVLQQIPRGAIGTIRGDPYESSRLLLPQTWREAFALDQNLLVVAPGTDMVLWTVPKDDRSADDLRAAAALAQKSGLVFRPLPIVVLRLGRDDWQVVQPN